MPRSVTIAGRILTEHDLDCPDCGSFLALVAFKGKVIYRCARYTSHGCRGAHGAHPDGKPLGVPAPWPVREARKRAHSAFDLLWRAPQGRMTRGAAYRWLQGALKMSETEAHISQFDAAQCTALLDLLRSDFGVEPERELGEGQVGFFDVRL